MTDDSSITTEGAENGQPVREYFRKISAYYQESVEREHIADLHGRIRKEIEPRLEGRILDIGSGGVTNYRNPRITLLVSYDNVFEFLKHSKARDVLHVNGDIRKIPFREETFDWAVIQFVIHHLTDRTLEQNRRNVMAAVSESSRILRKGGSLCIIDSMLPPWLETLEAVHYRAISAFFKALKKPMVFFFSGRRFRRILESHGLVVERMFSMPWGGMTEASQALFPRLRFPLDRTPMKCVFVQAKKCR